MTVTIPPPHADAAFAAALDALGTALVRAHTDPAAVGEVVVASQAVYAAGLNLVVGRVDRMAAQLDQAELNVVPRLDKLAQQLEALQRASLRPRDEELHDLRNKIQSAMDAMVMMQENRQAIETVYTKLQELATQVTDEIKAREDLGNQVERLRERVVGEQEPSQQ